jgi:hypothetical protein
MDDRRQRIIAEAEYSDAERYFGWEVAEAAGLDALAGKLDAAGVAVRHEPAVLADHRPPPPPEGRRAPVPVIVVSARGGTLLSRGADLGDHELHQPKVVLAFVIQLLV